MPGRTSRQIAWGIDVASSAIKGVRMRRSDDRVEILEADIIPLEGTPTAPDNPGRDRRIWQALQRFQARHPIGNERVVAGLPGGLFFTRPFKLFQAGLSTEADLVRFELEQHIPFGLDAVLWDHESFLAPSGSDREFEGVIFAMKKDVLNNYLLSFSAADIEPDAVQAAPLALYNFVRYEMAPSGPVLALDLGAGRTTLLAVDRERYVVRSLAVGGDTLTETMQKVFAPQDLKREDAEAIKVNLSQIERRGEVMERWMPALRTFVGQVRQAVEHLKRERPVEYERLFLLGGGVETSGLGQLLAQELQMRPVTPAGLAQIRVNGVARSAYVNRNLPALATAIGLGLQGLGLGATKVNVIGATLARRRSQTTLKRVAAAAVVGGLLLTACLGAFASWRTTRIASATRELEGQINPMALRNRQWQTLSRPGESEQFLDRFETLARERGGWLAVVEKVARMLPDNRDPKLRSQDKVWLLRLDLTRPDAKSGTLQGVIEVGAELRRDNTHLAFIERTVQVPLKNDERGMFRVTGEPSPQRSPALDFSGKGQGPDKYLLYRMEFQADLTKLQRP